MKQQKIDLKRIKHEHKQNAAPIEKMDGNVQRETLGFLTIDDSAISARTSKMFYVADQYHPYYRDHIQKGYPAARTESPKFIFWRFPHLRIGRTVYSDKPWLNYAQHKGLTIYNDLFFPGIDVQPIHELEYAFIGSEPFVPGFFEALAKFPNRGRSILRALLLGAVFSPNVFGDTFEQRYDLITRLFERNWETTIFALQRMTQLHLVITSHGWLDLSDFMAPASAEKTAKIAFAEAICDTGKHRFTTTGEIDRLMPIITDLFKDYMGSVGLDIRTFVSKHNNMQELRSKLSLFKDTFSQEDKRVFIDDVLALPDLNDDIYD